jgi:hypothetical protein
MRRVTYHVTKFPPASVGVGRPLKRGRLFAALLAALHQSRRLQAQRVLRQHQQLIAHEACQLKSSVEGGHAGK